MVTKNDLSLLITQYIITLPYVIRDGVQCSISPGSGTLIKQADKNRTGLLKVEIWARSGENVGRIWDPNETHIAYWQPT